MATQQYRVSILGNFVLDSKGRPPKGIGGWLKDRLTWHKVHRSSQSINCTLSPGEKFVFWRFYLGKIPFTVSALLVTDGLGKLWLTPRVEALGISFPLKSLEIKKQITVISLDQWEPLPRQILDVELRVVLEGIISISHDKARTVAKAALQKKATPPPTPVISPSIDV